VKGNQLRNLNVLPVTVANANNLGTDLCDLSNDLSMCELLLFMFDIEDDA
jgi:hypothetical protein